MLGLVEILDASTRRGLRHLSMVLKSTNPEKGDPLRPTFASSIYPPLTEICTARLEGTSSLNNFPALRAGKFFGTWNPENAFVTAPFTLVRVNYILENNLKANQRIAKLVLRRAKGGETEGEGGGGGEGRRGPPYHNTHEIATPERLAAETTPTIVRPTNRVRTVRCSPPPPLERIVLTNVRVRTVRPNHHQC